MAMTGPIARLSGDWPRTARVMSDGQRWCSAASARRPACRHKHITHLTAQSLAARFQTDFPAGNRYSEPVPFPIERALTREIAASAKDTRRPAPFLMAARIRLEGLLKRWR